MKKKLIPYIIILIAVFPALLPLMNHGFFTTDDGEWMIIRFTAFYSALRDGQFPVRFLGSLNHNYGYPVPTFLYPGFLYLGIPIQIITSNFVNTIKIIFAISLFGSTIFTFLWLNKLFSKTASAAGAIVSLYLPYHLYDVYTRGSVGEVFAMMWVPFILYNIERQSLFFSAIGITFLILSHNTLAVLFLPLIIIYMFLKLMNTNKHKKRLATQYAIYIITGLAMCAFFIVPALVELPMTVFSQTKISDPQSYFANENLIGQITFFMISLSLITYIYNRSNTMKNKNLLILFFLISLISILTSSSLSANIWKNIPSSWIQFPFRLLSYLVISIPFLTAWTLTRLNSIMKATVIIITSVLLFTSALPFSTPNETFDKGDAYYYTNQATTTVHDEYMPIWTKQKPHSQPDKKIEVINGEAVIENLVYNNKQISFTTINNNKATIQVNTIYWPGWSLTVNTNIKDINYKNPKGVIQFEVPQGRNSVNLNFSETPLRSISNLISILSITLVFILSKTNLSKNNSRKMI